MRPDAEGYVQLRRGLLHHMPGLSPLEVKVYVGLLMLARHSGPTAGHVTGTLDQLAEMVGHSRQVVGRALHTLAERHAGREPYITYEPAPNQWQPMRVVVLRYVPVQEVTDHGGQGCE